MVNLPVKNFTVRPQFGARRQHVRKIADPYKKFDITTSAVVRAAREMPAEVGGRVADEVGRMGQVASAALATKAHSLACRRNCDHADIAVDLHRRIQLGGAAANILEKSTRAGTLDEEGLKQRRIVRASMSFRLPFAGDR
jgi:hypothetical protein